MDKLEPYLRCGECESRPADFDCLDCKESYCTTCMETVHGKGLRRQHTRNRRLFVCQSCIAVAATVSCSECDTRRSLLCDGCSAKVHGPKGRGRRHKDISRLGEAKAANGSAASRDTGDDDDASRNGIGIRVNGLVANDARHSSGISAMEVVLRDQREAHALQAGRGPTDDDASYSLDDLPPMGLPLTADATQQPSSDPRASAPSEPLTVAKSLFTDVETQKLVLGDAALLACIAAWRRITKAFTHVVLFGSAANKALLSGKPPSASALKLLSKDLFGPDPVAFQLTALPRFIPCPEGHDTLNESGFDLAFLAVALRRGLLADIFASVAHRDVGCYLMRYYLEGGLARRIEHAGLVAVGKAKWDPQASTPANPHDAVEAARMCSPRRRQEAIFFEDNNTDDSSKIGKAQLRRLLNPAPEYVVVDDVLPFSASGAPLFGATVAPRRTETYKMLVMKGYSKFRGSYGALHQANPARVMRHIAGGRVIGIWWGKTQPSSPAQALLKSTAAGKLAWWLADSCGKRGATLLFGRLHQAIGAQHQAAWATEAGADVVGDVMDAETGAVFLKASEVSAAQAASMGAKHRRGTSVRSASVVPPAALAASAVVESNASGMFEKDMFRLVKVALPHSSASAPLLVPSQNGGQQLEPSASPRFSYHGGSALWTKELRDAFDFQQQSDEDVACASPLDLVSNFDGAIVGLHDDDAHQAIAPPVFCMWPKNDPHHRPHERRILLHIQPRVNSSELPRFVVRADAFEVEFGRPTAATAAISLQLVVIPNATLKSISEIDAIVDAALTTQPEDRLPTSPYVVTLEPVVQTNALLGSSVTRPDLFTCRIGVPVSNPQTPKNECFSPSNRTVDDATPQPPVDMPPTITAVLLVEPLSKGDTVLVAMDFGNSTIPGSPAATRSAVPAATANAAIVEFAHILSTGGAQTGDGSVSVW